MPGLPGYSYLGGAPLPGNGPAGIKADDFLVTTAVSTGVTYDSNIFETNTHPFHDWIFFVSPTVDILHDGGRSVQEFLASGTVADYARSSADNYQDAYVSLRETYNVSPTGQLFAFGAYSYGEQRRISQNFQIPSDAASPAPEQILLGSVGFAKEWARVQIGTSVTVSSEDFSNIRSLSGAIINQQVRNEQDLLVNSYIAIQLSRFVTTEFFVQGLDSTFATSNLDYSQFRVANTTTVALTSQTDIGFLVGVREQDVYNNPSLHLGPLAEYEVQVNWRPTPLLNFRAIAGYQDLAVDYVTGVNFGGFAPYYAFDFSYLICRNLGFQAGIAFEKRYLAGTPDVENILNYKAAVTYDLNANVGVSLLVSTQQWTSRLAVDNFNETIVESSLNFRF